MFRALERLVEAGVARRLELEGHVYAYVACDPTHHHHLSCSICGRVEEIPESWVSPIASRASEQLDFEIDDARPRLLWPMRGVPRHRLTLRSGGPI